MFLCNECGRKFKTVRAAEKAAYNGCPKCGGVDIEPDYGACSRSSNPPDADQFARVMKLTPGQIMRSEEEDYERRLAAGFSEPTRDTMHPEGF